MQRSRRAVLAVLCVLALALGAATLTDTMNHGGGGTPGEPSTPQQEPSPSWNLNLSSDGGISAAGGSLLCLEFLLSAEFFALATIAFLLLGAILYRRGGVLLAISGIGLLFPPVFVFWAVLTVCGPRAPLPRILTNQSMSGGTGGLFGGTTSGVIPGGTTPTISDAVLLLAGVLVVLVALLVLIASGDDTGQSADNGPDEDVPADDALVGLAGVARDAADRIESADGDAGNEVYRAWREMTAFLDVPRPQSSTPAEFRDAAGEAGMAGRHVDALTEVFREVRYGGESPTADREARAVEALRAIESTYGDGGDEDA